MDTATSAATGAPHMSGTAPSIYADRIEVRSEDRPTLTVFDAYRHANNDHVWLEMTGDAPEDGCDALLGIALDREQAEQLAALLARFLAGAQS